MDYWHDMSRFKFGGKTLSEAQNVMILLHGRGSSAENILTLAGELDLPETCFIAPQATQNSWYPFPFIAPVEQNEPALSSALDILGKWFSAFEGQIKPENTFLIGFSQGACLALEFAARHPKPYGGVFGLSGGLIGKTLNLENYKGNFENAPVFLGCSDTDPHIPKERVLETEKILRGMGANVQTKLYPNELHTINKDEIRIVNEILIKK